MTIKNKLNETVAEITEKGEVIPVVGKESEALNGLYAELVAVQAELLEARKRLNVAAVFEKSIREGLIK